MRDFQMDDLPKNRLDSQYFVFHLHESPSHTYVNLYALKSYFNVTVTYRWDCHKIECYIKKMRIGFVRLDSDFLLPSGSIEKLEQSNTNTDLLIENHLKNKTKLAAWIVSNCRATSKRELLVQELKKFIQVDVYGGCGPLKCDKQQCDRFLLNDYKFYLSFENSLCMWDFIDWIISFHC